MCMLFSVAGIDLENIVYYKDDTHYFVMTAKKQSLLDKGVILHVSRGFLLNRFLCCTGSCDYQEKEFYCLMSFFLQGDENECLTHLLGPCTLYSSDVF